jgi:hypothetical protein
MENSAKAGAEAYNSTRLIKEQIKNIEADTDLKGSQADVADVEYLRKAEEIHMLRQQMKNLQSTNKSVDMENILKQHEVELQELLGTKGSNWKMLFDVIKSLKGKGK